ncbi:MAG: DUF4190 domain-containing protein [Saprospiraceae bacterium]
MNNNTQGNSTLAIIGLVMGIIALVFSFVPCLGMVAILPGIIGLILGAIAFFQARDNGTGKGMPTATLILSVIAIGISGFQMYTMGQFAANASEDTIEYENCEDLIADLKKYTLEMKNLGEDLENKEDNSLSNVSKVMKLTFKIGSISKQGNKMGCDLDSKIVLGNYAGTTPKQGLESQNGSIGLYSDTSTKDEGFEVNNSGVLSIKTNQANPTVNQVLSLKDATTGEVEWKDDLVSSVWKDTTMSQFDYIKTVDERKIIVGGSTVSGINEGSIFWNGDMSLFGMYDNATHRPTTFDIYGRRANADPNNFTGAGINLISGQESYDIASITNYESTSIVNSTLKDAGLRANALEIVGVDNINLISSKKVQIVIDSVDLLVKKDTVQIRGVFVDYSGDAGDVNKVLSADINGRLNWAEGVIVDRVFDNYTSLRANTVDLDYVLVKDFTSTFKGSNYNTIGGIFYKSSTGTENGSTIIVSTNGTIWKRFIDNNTYIPEWFEVGGKDFRGLSFIDEKINAASNGVTAYYGGVYDDGDRIRYISHVAGENSVISLGREVNHFDIYFDIPIFKNQIWECNGVELKRASSTRAEVVVGEGTTISNLGNNYITLSSVVGYRVGVKLQALDKDALYQGRGYAENGVGSVSKAIPYIDNINGNTVNLKTTQVGYVIPSNSLMMRENVLLGVQVGDYGMITVNNGVFDGNVNNDGDFWFPADWRTLYTIELGSTTSNAIINNCFFKNTPAENITFAKGKVVNCRYQDLSGSFVHISSGVNSIDKTGVIVDHLTGENSNLLGNDLMGHSEALITFSANPHNVVFINSNCKNGTEGIIGENITAIGKMRVENNHFEDFDHIHYATNGTGTLLMQDLSFNNNTFINCGYIRMHGNVTNNLRNVRVSNNWFNHSKFYFDNIDGLQFVNNICVDDNIPYGVISGISFQNRITLVSSKNIRITDNTIIGSKNYDPNCKIGIGYYVHRSFTGTDTDFFKFQNVVISNNHIENYYRGVGEAGTIYQEMSLQMVGWEVSNNIIKMLDDTNKPNWGHGLEVYPGVIATGNTIYQADNVKSVEYPIVVHGIDDDLDGQDERKRLQGGIAIGNYIYGNGSSSKSIYIGAHGNGNNNQYNIICKDNMINGTVTTNATSLASAHISNNTVINTTILPELTNPKKPNW